jgi:hypothetical protein
MRSQSGLSAASIAINIFLVVCIAGLVFFGVNKMTQLNSAREELASTQIELTTTQAGLNSAQTSLANTETQLSQAQSNLASSEASLAVTRTDLETASQALDEKSSQLAQAQADYLASKQALDTANGASTDLQTTLTNLQANYASLTTGYGYVMTDPTYQQVKAFISADMTDSNPYVDDSYVCVDFSMDVISHALQQKFRCAYVGIRFVGENAGHAIVAFNTTDRGLVFFEPQSDEEVNLQAGKHYWTQCVITNLHYTTDFDDTIDRFNIIW